MLFIADHSDCNGAKLNKTVFKLSEINDIILKRANLSKTKMRWSKMRRADFLNSNLFGTDLHSENLRGANLEGATMRNTKLDATDITEATWIEGTQGFNQSCVGRFYPN